MGNAKNAPACAAAILRATSNTSLAMPFWADSFGWGPLPAILIVYVTFDGQDDLRSLDLTELCAHAFAGARSWSKGCPLAARTAKLVRIQSTISRLGDAVIDPTLWLDVMQDISAAMGATGAGLLQSDVRTPDIPRTAGVADVFGSYFADGWHARDVRGERGVPLLLRGDPVFVDQDVLTPEEIRRSAFYQDLIVPHGFQWFAAVGFRAGSALWAMAIQRTPEEGLFDQDDKRILGHLAQSLTETATLSRAVGQVALAGVTNGLQLVGRPALALDRRGIILGMNEAAERVLDEDVNIRNRRLIVRDVQASSNLDALINRLQATPDTASLPTAPIVVLRRKKRPLVIRVLPVAGAARTPFLGARLLLVLSDVDRTIALRPEVLERTFKLSPAEAKLARLVGMGMSLEQAADELRIAQETVRTQLKVIFSKTETHRQGELVALLAKLL